MTLVGGVVTSRLVAPGLVAERGTRLVRAGLLVGAVLLMGAALLEVAVTLKGVLGRLDAELYRRYLTSTRHGEMARLRLSLAPAAALVGVALTLPPVRRAPSALRWVGGLALVALCCGLLYTFGLLSHAAAMGGAAPLWADLVHFGVAALWAGPVLYLAAIGFGAGAGPGSDPARAATPARRALTRVSRLGMLAVPLLLLTGAFNALTHASDPAVFAASAYGWSLWVKLLLFALVLLVAAGNAFVWLPRFLRGHDGRALLRSVRLEAVLLLALFVATGFLTTSALPHGADASTDALENLRRSLAALGF